MRERSVNRTPQPGFKRSVAGRVTVLVALVASVAVIALAGPAAAAAGDIFTIAGNGTAGYSGDGGSATSAELYGPIGVAIDAEGNRLIVEFNNSRVRVVAVSASNPGYPLGGCAGTCTWTAGDIYTVAGNGGNAYNGDGIPATSAELTFPAAVAIDAHDNLLIADRDNDRVRLVAVSASNPGYRLGSNCFGGVVYVACTWTVGDIYTIAGSGAVGPGDLDGGPATGTGLYSPKGVTVDAEGNALIADSNSERVQLVAVSASNPGYQLGSDCLDGAVYVACTWTVGDIYTIAGSGVGGYNGDGVTATSAELYNPWGVAVDAHGNLLIADMLNRRVRVVAVSASNPGYPLGGCTTACTWTVGDIYTIAGDGAPVYNGDGIPATSAGLDIPTGLAVDAHGNLLIADSLMQRVRAVAVSASDPGYPLGGCAGVCTWTVGDIYTIAGNANLVGGFSGDGGPATSALLDGPTDVAVDAKGNAYIADEFNERVREVLVGGTVPGAPRSVSAESGNGNVTVHWAAPASNGGSPISSYSVTASPGGKTVTVSSTHLSATVAESQPGSYSFRVRATNALGLGPWSSPSNAVTIAPVKQTGSPGSGYWMLGSDGHVYPFGSAGRLGSAPGPVVAIAARVDGRGYWTVDAVGNVSHFGTAGAHGGTPTLNAGERVSTISATPSGNGYWLFTNRGRAFAYGDAHFYGDMSAVVLNGPIVASVATPTGHGYYMVGSDGGVFSFGDAHFHGSTGNLRLNRPIVGISPTPDNRGYWLVASDGGVFAFTAPFRGSMGAIRLNRPVNGLVAYGNGYLMVASDGGVFDFSNKAFVGSLANNPPSAPIIGIAAA